ncbi:hypothetical protein FE257_008169 [Aspergillus nanangensis]|uniref:Carrier domain-containing protein n=1 Tax=Aspergillus nanangensis TaxID=2582783 RepID=A0AAD4CM08_ASPNN|nr:hypothetical protein FE257_008169 [Aspergillus nanangensis]
MSLVHHPQLVDLRSDDPFSHAEVLNEKLLNGVESSVEGYEPDEEWPVTPAQREILELDQSSWCRISLILPRQSAPDASRIRPIWKYLCSLHCCLRTVLRTDPVSGQVFQRIVCQTTDYQWDVDEPSPASSSNSCQTEAPSDDQVAQLIVKRDTSSGGLRLTIRVRRALVDGTSLETIKRNFVRLYFDLPVPEHTPLASYHRFLAYTKNVSVSADFWKGQLSGAFPLRALPWNTWVPDGSNPQERRALSLHLDETSHPGLARLEHASGLPRKLIYETLWACVLHCHSGSNDVLYAAVERDASFPDASSCVGFLDNTYPVRVAIDGEEVFRDVSDRINKFHESASTHAFLGYGQITQYLPCQVESVLRYSPDGSGPTMAGQMPSFPLALFINGTSPATLTICHSTLTSSTDAQLLLEHFSHALRSALDQFYLPHTLLEKLDLQSRDEKLNQVHMAQSLSQQDQHSTIPTLFEEQVIRSPDAVAVQFEDDLPLTYVVLNARANRAARALAAYEVKGRVIPICIDRSVSLIVTLLATLKAGAAYTILDPDGPVERNQLIVRTCGADLVLTTDAYSSHYPGAVVLEGGADNAVNSFSSSNLNLAIKPEERCYVVFTSGSTGSPKGAVITHGAATNGMAYHALNGYQRWLLSYNPTFSAAQRTMMSTLVHGGTLLLASKQRLTTQLAETVQTMQVEALGITPSALSVLRPDEVPSLKQVTLVGEKITRETVINWAEHVHLRNTFGLSECAQLNFGSRLYATSNPGIVGRPTDTTQVYILKPGTIELTPMGVAGELCLAGPQLASGYLSSEADSTGTTGDVFVPNPFGAGRMYRTRDMARMHADGVEILGRLDFQAKINGQKVNPAEIDRNLSQHPGIAQCAVVAVEMRNKSTLIAAIVPFPGQSWLDLVTSLRAYADEKLPAYMVPSLWMEMLALPTSPNGKVDVRTIRSQALDTGWEALVVATVSSHSEALTDAVELQISKVWADVLSLPVSAIGRSTSFLALGGTSIEGIKAINELRKLSLSIDLGHLLGGSLLKDVATHAQPISSTSHNLEHFALLSDSNLRQELQQDGGIMDAYPATPLQEGLLTSIQESHGMYTYQRVWDIRELNLARLHSSFETAFEHSDILRTAFVPHGRGLMQVVRKDFKLSWADISCSLEDYLADYKQRTFSLAGPLIRAAVIQGQQLVVTTHHALFDFWSHRFLYEDAARVYLGKSLNPRPSFKEFVGYLMTTPKADYDTFWGNYLKDSEPTVLNTVPVPQTTAVQMRIPWNRERQMKEYGLSAGPVLYAAWAVILSHHARQSDVGFITTLSGRDVPVTGVDRMDGPTLTSVPQRVTISPGTTLLDLANSVRVGLLQVLKTCQHGIRNALDAAGLGADHFDTLVNILVKDQDREEVAQIFRRHGERPMWHSEYTTLEIEEIDNELLLKLSSQMEPRRVEFLVDAYASVVRQFVNDPTVKVAELTIMGEREKQFLYNTLSNRDTLHLPAPSTLHSCFEGFAREQASVVAINWDAREHISYAQLDSRASRLANFLARAGVQVGDAVPLMLDKSVDMIVAILGVMKAGAAYVPLSPDNPVDRNAFIVSDVGAKFAIIHRTYMDMIQGSPDFKAICVDDPDIVHLSDVTPDVHISPDCIAYIIYTSGSTGMPKGVKVPHQAAAAAVTSMVEAEGRHVGEWKTVQFANYVFDASVQDIFNTLSTGGTLCMAPSDKMQSDLPGVIREMSAHQAILTPTVARLLDPAEVLSFDTLIVGGEPLTPDVITRWSGRRILNVYGPTETSMVITTKEVDPTGRPGNIGAPFPTVMAFVLHPESTTLVPYGSVGELCVAGPQVTAGYVNREDLSRAVFLEDVLDTPRLYRTGDLARWLPGGELECLGRKDSQVKINGHRIELAEIEQAILTTGLVQGAAVQGVLVKGNKQLVAFCVFQPGSCEILSAEDHTMVARQLLSSLNTLAHYMVPKYIIPVGDFPKMPSRKTDRKLLARWVDQLDLLTLSQYAFEGSGTQETIIPVTTENEFRLQQFWAQILGLSQDNIGKNSHFLSLGGDSIAAISVTSLSRKAGFTLTVKDMLKTPVLEQLAMIMRIDDRQKRISETPTYRSPASVIHTVKNSGLSMEKDVEYVYPCPPGQVQFLEEGDRPEQMWVLMTARRMPKETQYGNWIENTTQLTKVNHILRTSWTRSSETEWLDVTIFSCANDEERTSIMDAFWEDRFTFGQAFIKYTILLHPDDTWELIIKMNHAVYDGTLLRIFDDHFASIVEGKHVPVHGEFKDLAYHVYRSDKDKSLQFWKHLMQYKTYTWPLTQNPRVTASVRQMVPRNLEAVARVQGVTVSILFQAAYQLWLAQASDQKDISFDYLLSGRNVDLDGVDPQTINGTLANFLPVRCTINHQQPLQEYLQATQDLFWAITENGNVGLNDIYVAAGLSRQTAKNNCLFLYQPFEPTTINANQDASRWLIMAKSQVRMFQPYALVAEVAKALNNAHRLTIMYDASVFTREEAEQIATQISTIATDLADMSSDKACLGDLLR